MTGRNHTTNGMATITEAASGFPSSNWHIPVECATIYQASRPRVSMLGADPVVPGAFADIGRHDGITPGARRAHRPARRPLFYANAELVRDAIEQAVGSARPWYSSWTATTTSTSPAPSSSAS
jgi:hypothetical protein